MKGLILAGGKGTRLLPATRVINKHMVPILNTPMIMYPLETLKSFNIKDIMVVSGGGHIGGIADFLNDGSEFGVKLTYRVQKEAGGIAEALALAEDFVGEDDVMVILGDNIFGDITDIVDFKTYGDAAILVKYMNGASRFGVLVEDSIIEKPKDITIGDVVTGLYVYPPDVFDVVKTLKPSNRGELEITDVNNFYLSNDRCKVFRIDESYFWSDAGTPESLKEVTNWAYDKSIKNK